MAVGDQQLHVRRHEFANSSFYTNLVIFAGILFGMFEYSLVIRGRLTSPDVLAFLLGAFGVYQALVYKSYKLRSAGARLYAFDRPQLHIVADILNSFSLTAIFAIFAYIYGKSESLLDANYDLQPSTVALLVNTAGFVVSTVLYSMLAKQERKPDET